MSVALIDSLSHITKQGSVNLRMPPPGEYNCHLEDGGGGNKNRKKRKLENVKEKGREL